MTRKARSSAAQKRRLQQQPRTNPMWLVAGGVALVVVVAAVIALALASSQPSVAEPAQAAVVVSGTPLPAYASGQTDQAIGMPLPTLQGTDIDGLPMTIQADGRAKVIVVLAHWCPHCQGELPHLVEWLASDPLPDGVDLIGLSSEIDPARPNYPPSAWLAREGWTQPTMNDDAASTAYGALGHLATPGWVFVSADGTVYGRTTGELATDTLDQIIAQLAP